MKLGSLFDGSGGFPLAGSICGIDPVWAAEVEPYPIAVTKSRFPNMKHLGDVSKVSGAEIDPVDIITFGSPCQDLSVAGKREGLKHESAGDDQTTRSGLFLEAIRIVKEMRCSTGGVYPRYVIWENVPGAFSSRKGEDFRTVFQEIIRIAEPEASMPEVPQGGWARADCYSGDGWSIAYRVFDAQYWGVPQRRRRIYLVADFRGQRAKEILFERKGLRGYFAEGGTPWQGTARDAEGCIVANDREGEGGVKVYDARGNGDGTLASTLTGDHQNRITDYTSVVCAPILDDQGGQQINVRMDGKSPTLRAESHGNLPCVCEPLAYSMQGFGDYKETGVASGLKARDYKDATDLVAFGVDCRNATEYPELNGTLQAKASGGFSLNCNQIVRHHYIVRRLTPTECARLQGFPDWWSKLEPFSDWEFWRDVRNTHAAINGRATKDYTEAQMLTWYNKLHTDYAEYKMWGNGIALPCALYVMQGITED